jgi:hypothetical protein
MPAGVGGLISATTWGSGAAPREATPASMIRKVQAQIEAVQSNISMAPIYSLVRGNFLNFVSPTSQLNFRDASPLGFTSVGRYMVCRRRRFIASIRFHI